MPGSDVIQIEINTETDVAPLEQAIKNVLILTGMRRSRARKYARKIVNSCTFHDALGDMLYSHHLNVITQLMDGLKPHLKLDELRHAAKVLREDGLRAASWMAEATDADPEDLDRVRRIREALAALEDTNGNTDKP